MALAAKPNHASRGKFGPDQAKNLGPFTLHRKPLSILYKSPGGHTIYRGNARVLETQKFIPD